MRNYYAMLQVDPRADPEVIDAAYRRLARKYHPDTSRDPDAVLRMRELNDAYDVLSDPARRRAYDAAWHASSRAPRARRSRPAASILVRIMALAGAVLALRFLPLIARQPALLLGAAVASVWVWWQVSRSRRRR